jgi:lipopolysaccharide transport system permease protein
VIKVEITNRKSVSQKIREVLEFRELLYFFAWKDIRVKYKQAVLGFLWAILQPLLLMLVFTMLASAISLNSGTIPYPIFAFSGIIFWNIFASGVQTAGNSIVTNAHIIKKIFFPKLILPVSAVLVSIFDFLIAFLVLVAMMFYYSSEIQMRYRMFYLIPALLMVMLASFGTGTLLSAFNVKYRDFKYIIPFVIQLGFFASPVIYPSLTISNPLLALLYNANPFVGIMALVRFACFNMPFEISQIFPGLITAIVVFVVGIVVFFRMERNFADIA